jgi:hypothetical protein
MRIKKWLTWYAVKLQKENYVVEQIGDTCLWYFLPFVRSGGNGQRRNEWLKTESVLFESVYGDDDIVCWLTLGTNSILHSIIVY